MDGTRGWVMNGISDSTLGTRWNHARYSDALKDTNNKGSMRTQLKITFLMLSVSCLRNV